MKKGGLGRWGWSVKRATNNFFCVCAQNKYKSVETKTFCNNIKIANETEQKTVAEGERGDRQWHEGALVATTFDRVGLAFIGNSVAICVNDS